MYENLLYLDNSEFEDKLKYHLSMLIPRIFLDKNTLLEYLRNIQYYCKLYKDVEIKPRLATDIYNNERFESKEEREKYFDNFISYRYNYLPLRPDNYEDVRIILQEYKSQYMDFVVRVGYYKMEDDFLKHLFYSGQYCTDYMDKLFSIDDDIFISEEKKKKLKELIEKNIHYIF